MKSILNTVLPAMALLTLGGCASTSALTSTESDGVYYSSKDRTTYNEPARSTAAVQNDASEGSSTTDAETNPDYASSGSSSSSSRSGGSEYYDEDYGYSARIRRFHQPGYRSFNYGYYDPFYADPFWYGGSAFSYYGGGYSPYGWGPGYYGSYYDPFYGPYGYGNTAVIINIGFGRPYYNPWGYGYGYGYGYGGYGRGYYDGYRNGLYSGYGSYYGGTVGSSRSVRYAPRTGRSLEATTDGRASTGTNPGRGRTREGGVANTEGGVNTTGNAAGNGRSRERSTDNPTGGISTSSGIRAEEVNTGRTRTGSEQVQRRSNTAVFTDETGTQVETRDRGSVDQTRTTESGGRRWRVVENTGSSNGQQATTTPAYPNYSEQRRSRSREAYGSEQPTRQDNTGGQAAEQPARRQRSYESPQQPTRTYEAPQRSYEAPQRSYSEPSRSSSPSMGGGSSGGGGGRSSGGGRGRE
ncbi:hypothetical protein [Hymenobacter cellulosivorans]|uniref:Uncharacterized protein n=1 Tax=Hymenobacter cellulosivorans TaxID=2932249 RepID=A0ABY4FCQ2_9BACT|nr:hypothetical protein [Hymenobacter cellulosivorans]UOQ54268.1 hypothetical protein MUN80_05800 [Hymenobacter cellulosivorans]